MPRVPLPHVRPPLNRVLAGEQTLKHLSLPHLPRDAGRQILLAPEAGDAGYQLESGGRQGEDIHGASVRASVHLWGNEPRRTTAPQGRCGRSTRAPACQPPVTNLDPGAPRRAIKQQIGRLEIPVDTTGLVKPGQTAACVPWMSELSWAVTYSRTRRHRSTLMAIVSTTANDPPLKYCSAI